MNLIKWVSQNYKTALPLLSSDKVIPMWDNKVILKGKAGRLWRHQRKAQGHWVGREEGWLVCLSAHSLHFPFQSLSVGSACIRKRSSRFPFSESLGSAKVIVTLMLLTEDETRVLLSLKWDVDLTLGLSVHLCFLSGASAWKLPDFVDKGR